MKDLSKEQEATISKKFFSDPDWILVEEMLYSYIEPMRDISTIDLNRGSDAVMADVAGRQKAYDGITKFLKACGALRTKTINKVDNNSNFK